MIDAGKLLWQVVKIVFGYGLALASAGLFLAWGLFQPQGIEGDPARFAATVWTGAVSGMIIGGMAAVPAFAAILVAEILRMKSLILNLAAGGLIAFGLWSLGEPGVTAGEPALRPGTSVALAAGFVAGFVYWLVAGRTAGSWRIARRTQDPAGNAE
ncbi:translation initiation factor IF-3 [Rhizobiales bacterium]|uniref:translation initiation factor IF-3 n=1 Tax=Hongsoonwoonella zoysiae TaxID=2821844 RepID=UPI0015612DF6|nr:translation initiation factor IF-3 [Hongsoonwoonella zoysiae]NRG17107.1 translation initiation factor IF-3 [Hongsoonwoonella zoysiae]